MDKIKDKFGNSLLFSITICFVIISITHFSFSIIISGSINLFSVLKSISFSILMSLIFGFGLHYRYNYN